MKKLVLVLGVLVFLAGCKGKKNALTDEETVDADDFIGFFRPLSLPIQLDDGSMEKRETDSTRIGYKLFTRFVPDSVLTKHFPKGTRPRLYPVGRFTDEKKVTYLLVKAVAPTRKLAYVLCFNQKHVFLASKLLIFADEEDHITHSASIDPKFTITVSRQRKAADGTTYFIRDAYFFADPGFMLILKESNEPAAKPAAVYNPIDTLPKRHKLSGDYLQDKRNFISIRDGKDVSHLRFFIHFEKDKGECKGELKGEAKMTTAGVAQYTANGDPCMIQFNFSTGKISITELQGCGNHRDIKCFFEGVFYKRKDVKIKTLHGKK
jgi:hypothetical protein